MGRGRGGFWAYLPLNASVASEAVPLEITYHVAYLIHQPLRLEDDVAFQGFAVVEEYYEAKLVESF